MTKPKWYHYLLAAGSQDPDNPSPRMHNPYEEASAYANKDEKKLREIHEDQIEYEKKATPVKAATAVAAVTLPLWGPYALHVGKVLLNPATAKTALGGAIATTADVVGTGYGIKRNSELLNKWASGNFNYSDPVEFGLNLIPGYVVSKLLGASGKVGAKMSKTVANSIDWYNSIMKKGGDRIPISSQHISQYYGNAMEGEKFSPLETIDYFKKGKIAAGKFFEHPVVKEAEKHNIALAKRLGITLNPRPEDISAVVQRPMKVQFHTGEPAAFVAQGHYNDPNAYMSIQWTPVTKEWMNIMGRHEGLHTGFYSAPFSPSNMSPEYYKNVYTPEAHFWIMKTDKLLKPEYRILRDGIIHDDGPYITNWRGGEAGPNLIDMGRELGLKLGQPYPGDEVFMDMMNNYKGAKSFLLKFLDTDTRAGRRHIWDAMVGKYFAIPAAAAVSSAASYANQQNPYKNETRK